MSSDHPIEKCNEIALPDSVVLQPTLDIALCQFAAHHGVITALLAEPNRTAGATPHNFGDLREQLCQPALFPWLREDDGYIEAALEVLPHSCNLRRSDLLHYLTIRKFLLAVFGDEELIAMGVLEPLDVGNVLLVDRSQPQRHQKDVGLAEVVQFADQLADRTISVLQVGHLNAIYTNNLTNKASIWIDLGRRVLE